MENKTNKYRGLTKEEAFEKASFPFLTILNIISHLSFWIIIAAVPIWIWMGWSLGWRIALTGLFINLVINNIAKQTRDQFTKAINKEFGDDTKIKSRFQQRLEELEKQKNETK